MNTGRVLLGVVGIVVAGLGLAMVTTPSVAALFPVERTWVGLAGVLAFAQAARVFLELPARERDHRMADAGAAEDVPARATPGADFDELVSLVADAGDPRTERSRRERVERRLRRAGLRALEHHGHSREEAVRLLETGEWTENEVAASFFADVDRELPATDGLRGLLGMPETGTQSFVRRAEQAASEIATLAGIEAAARDRSTDGGNR